MLGDLDPTRLPAECCPRSATFKVTLGQEGCRPDKTARGKEATWPGAVLLGVQGQLHREGPDALA